MECAESSAATRWGRKSRAERMSVNHAYIHWRLQGSAADAAAFLGGQYSRRHVWEFDGGARVDASASPHVVPTPLSDAAAVDPEEAFVASIASCHMLWFLSLAAKQGFTVESYDDWAEGTLALDDEGQLAMTAVVLRPRIVFASGSVPSRLEQRTLHERAHQACFIAKSVRTKIRCEPFDET